MSVALNIKGEKSRLLCEFGKLNGEVHMLINLVFVFPSWSELFEISDLMTFETGVHWNRGPGTNNETFLEFCVCLHNDWYFVL